MEMMPWVSGWEVAEGSMGTQFVGRCSSFKVLVSVFLCVFFVDERFDCICGKEGSGGPSDFGR